MSEKKERKEFDDMWDIPRLYVSACSNSVQLVPLHHFFIWILFHHYKELLEYKREVEELEQEGDILQLKHDNHNGGYQNRECLILRSTEAIQTTTTERTRKVYFLLSQLHPLL
jgi:hypothetical protein